MKIIVKLAITVLLGILLADTFERITPAAQEQKSIYFLRQLKVKDKVIVAEKNDRYTITIMAEGSTHEVADIGQDYVTCKDAAGTETLIPIYAVKCIVKIKTAP